jgi:putative oxidoreductase
MKALLHALYHPRAGYHLLRVSVALMLLLHGIGKVMNGIGGIEKMVVAHGQPAFLAYFVYVGEVIAPLLVLAGFWVGPAALVMAINMVVAVAMAHAGQVFQLGPQGGWAIELQGLFLVGSLAVALMAPPSSR